MDQKLDHEKRRYKRTGGLHNLDIEKSSWIERNITIEELLAMIREERTLIHTISKR